MTTDQLLKRWVDGWEKRAAKVRALLKAAGLDDESIDSELKLRVGKPEPVRQVPTLEAGVRHRPTPMLEARFHFAGTIRDATEKWLGPAEMDKARANKKLMKHFTSHHDHWTGSAPAVIPKERLSLFAYDVGAEENQTYLVWPERGGGEPQVWRYHGQNERRFKDLDKFLAWAADSGDE
jgi:hypothetical protein